MATTTTKKGESLIKDFLYNAAYRTTNTSKSKDFFICFL